MKSTSSTSAENNASTQARTPLRLVLGGLFIIFSIVFSYYLYSINGWQAIAKDYPSYKKYNGLPPWAGVTINYTPYKHLIVIGIYKEGLSLRPTFSLTSTHAPILIPWQKLSVVNFSENIFQPYVTLSVTHTAKSQIVIYGESSKDIVDKINLNKLSNPD